MIFCVFNWIVFVIHVFSLSLNPGSAIDGMLWENVWQIIHHTKKLEKFQVLRLKRVFPNGTQLLAKEKIA